MAFAGLLALLDDITVMLDDVAVMSKVAVKKSAGIIGDDLAVGAGSVSSPDPSRELPVVWAVAKGSFINKLYLIPGALFLNAVAPFAIKPLLVAGGVFFCFEAVEKILHARKHHKTPHVLQNDTQGLTQSEEEKIRGAINTDLVLSAEIVVITLGAVATAPFLTQVAVLCAIGVLLTVGIYGLVAGIVKLDDLGLHLSQRRSKAAQFIGRGLVTAAPWIMKALTIIGTVAMLLVGGDLIIHGISPLAHAVHGLPWLATTGVVVLTALLTGFAAIPAVKFSGIIIRKALSMMPHKQGKNRHDR